MTGRKVCGNGHPQTEANVYRWRNRRFCRPCRTEAQQRIRLTANGYRRKREIEIRIKYERMKMLDAIRWNRGCIDCGTTEGILHFDHCNGDKEFEIAHGLTYSLKRLMAEVAKCDVRCASCHRRRHARIKREKLGQSDVRGREVRPTPCMSTV